MSLLCGIGLHRWEKEPHHRELLRSRGIDVLFVTAAVQYGRRRCESCGTVQECYREGWCGLGGSAGRWKRCSPARKAKIECLPVL